MSIIAEIKQQKNWEDFLEYKESNRHLPKTEKEGIQKFIAEARYMHYAGLMEQGHFPASFPNKKIINKMGTDKKRIVYSFETEKNIVLKFIAYRLWAYDDYFSGNCYAFRKGYGVRDAVRRIRRCRKLRMKYCFKADISNYFNSIPTEQLLERLTFVKERDPDLYRIFAAILNEKRVWENGNLIFEEHGAMAGTPLAPFFANVYLAGMDRCYEEKQIPYFRYSDDILIFVDTKEELARCQAEFYQRIEEEKLAVNEAKVCVRAPGEILEFLGFSFDAGKVDLSESTKRKIKGKIKRKAEALRRWQRKKKLSSDKAAIGFIRAMNHKFYGEEKDDDFTWNRWFFPNLTESAGLKEIDAYMQEYIRYSVTGRHYKGNYRISYEQMKKWGYRSLVHEYYKVRKQ